MGKANLHLEGSLTLWTYAGSGIYAGIYFHVEFPFAHSFIDDHIVVDNFAGQMEREEINEKLSILGRRMEELKLEIHSATMAATSTFSNFDSAFEATSTLSDKVKAISDEMQELSEKIETEVCK
jgi:hypothetical protein